MALGKSAQASIDQGWQANGLIEERTDSDALLGLLMAWVGRMMTLQLAKKGIGLWQWIAVLYGVCCLLPVGNPDPALYEIYAFSRIEMSTQSPGPFYIGLGLLFPVAPATIFVGLSVWQ
jgi:hypothetical protein